MTGIYKEANGFQLRELTGLLLRLLPWRPLAGLNEQLLQQAIGITSRPKFTFSPLELKRVQDIKPWRIKNEAVGHNGSNTLEIYLFRKTPCGVGLAQGR